jgi:hypothetical protein
MEMRDEDQPPEQIWLNPEALDAHFDWVKDKYRSKAEGVETVGDPGSWDQNEATKGMR